MRISPSTITSVCSRTFFAVSTEGCSPVPRAERLGEIRGRVWEIRGHVGGDKGEIGEFREESFREESFGDRNLGEVGGQEAVKESSFPEGTSTRFVCSKVLLLFAG